MNRACNCHTDTRCGEDNSVQHRWCTPRLLQLNSIWSTNVQSIEAATCAKFSGSSYSQKRLQAEPLLPSLHWLLIKQQIYYKLATLTYINTGLPKRYDISSYLGDQNVVAIGNSYIPCSTVNKNSNSKSSIQRVRTSGLEQSTRIHASM